MAIGTLTQKLRPIRVAFLVNPSKRADVLLAIKLSSMLWGGISNPIVPCYGGRLPKIWSREKFIRPDKPRAITDGYLEGFDPDVVVPISTEMDGKYTVGNRDVVSPSEMMDDISKSGRPGVGIGAFELVRHMADTDFKFIRKNPISVILPKFERSHELFLSSLFGAWPAEVASLIKAHFGSMLDISEPKCSVRSFHPLLDPKYLFPRRIGTLEIKYRPRGAKIYCLDATNTLDILDFWNLRAAGFYVVPAPMQAFDSPEFRVWIKEFVELSYPSDAEEKHRFVETTFLVGRSLEERDVTTFTSSLNIDSWSSRNHPKFVIQRWYPRLWDRWARENTDEKPEPFYSGERDTPLDDSKSGADVRAYEPPFECWGASKRFARYTNEINYKVYESIKPLAEVLPEGSKNLAKRISFGSLSRLRLSTTGPVYLVRSYDQRIHFTIPEAESFMLEWLKAEGWKVDISSPGLLANQMLLRLKGKFGVHAIASEGLLRLLDKHASEKLDPDVPGSVRSPKWITEKELTVQLDRILKLENRLMERSRLLHLLLEKDVLRLGLELHCPTCARWLWKSTEHLSEEVECENCLSKFSIALAPKNEREWSYKPVGPFNVKGFAGGAYSVLLAWKFFGGGFDRSTTPIFSFNASKGGKLHEVDMALFCTDGGWRTNAKELLMVECKAYDEFKRKDVERMEALSLDFPGAFLVFAKLDRNFSESERRLLTAVVNKQRRLWKARKPHCSIMILTGTELFSEWDFPECWKGIGGKHNDAYKTWSHISSLTDFAEATVELYLGLPSRHAWFESERLRRQKRHAVTSTTSATRQ